MGRSQRLYSIVLIGFIFWYLIFLGQLIYFSSFSFEKFFVFSSKNKLKSFEQKTIPYDFHRQPLLRQYQSRHVNFHRFFQPNPTSTKYLIYTCNQPCGGWGDRTRKIAGAFLLSLALNRTFLINMTWPCSINQFLEPNFIRWNQTIKNLSKRSNLTVTNLTASDNDYRLVLLWNNIDIIYFQVKDLAYYSLLLWRDDFYRVLHLQYGLHRSTLFLHTCFTLIYELLFKLRPHLQTHFDFIVKNSSFESLRCAHIRIGKNPSNPNDMIFPKRERMNTTVISFLKNISRPNEMIFVSTDSEEVHRYAQKQFGSRLLTIDGLIQHIDRSGKQRACDAFEKTLLDFYMFSQCQTVVMSKSAFR